MSRCDEYSESSIATEDEYRCTNFNASQNFYESINDRDLGTNFGSTFVKIPTQKVTQYANNETRKITASSKASKLEQKSTQKEESKAVNANEFIKNKKGGQRCYIELEKEHCELPYVSLTENDENFIMDCGVKLRYGDSKSFSEVARELEAHLFKDFPLETYLQRTEILNSTLDVMVSTIDINVFNNCILIISRFLENSVTLYKFLLNPYNRFSESSTKLSSSKDQEHITSMYPSNDSQKWREIKFNPDSLTTTNFDSRSLSYTLCDIAIKALDCCLHEKKVGAALTVSAFIPNLSSYTAVQFKHSPRFTR